MTRDDIIRIAREAWKLEYIPESDVPKLERFYALVAAAERDACAKLVENCNGELGCKGYLIRARGEVPRG